MWRSVFLLVPHESVFVICEICGLPVDRGQKDHLLPVTHTLVQLALSALGGAAGAG